MLSKGVVMWDVEEGVVIWDVFSWLSSGMLSMGLLCWMLSFLEYSSEMLPSAGLSSGMLFRGCLL